MNYIGTLKQALEALQKGTGWMEHGQAIADLRALIEQMEKQEPCQYAIDVAMPEYRCVGKCQYATTPPPSAPVQEPVALPENAARLLIDYWIAEKYGKEYTYKIVEDGNCWAWWIDGRSDVESEDLDCGTCYIHWDGRIEDYTSLPDAYTPPPAAQPAPVQEPVGEIEQIDIDDDGQASAWLRLHNDVEVGQLLYTTPLAAPVQGPAKDDRAVFFKQYIKECDKCAIVPDVAGAFNAGWQAAAPVQEPANLHQVLTDPENQPNQYGVKFGMHGEKMMFKVGGQQFALDYEPETQDEFDFMRAMLVHAFSTFTHGVKTTPPAAQPAVPVIPIETLAEKMANAECAAGEDNWRYMRDGERKTWLSAARVASTLLATTPPAAPVQNGGAA